MKQINICPRCGGELKFIEVDNNYKCAHCGSFFEEEKISDIEEKINLLLDEFKQEQIANARIQLWDALHEKHISSERILDITRIIKTYLPDDFMANFFEFVNTKSNTQEQINEYINNIDVKENYIYIDVVLDFMIRSLESSNLLSLNNLIENTYKNTDLKLYNEYTSKLAVEAEKVKSGVYDLSIERDVFVAYSSKDIKYVEEVVKLLNQEGISYFVALENLRHGKGAAENYDKALETAIENSKTFLFISSENSRTRDCEALKKEMPYLKKLDKLNAPAEYRNDYSKIPLKYKKPRVQLVIGDKPKGTLGDKQVAEIFDGYEWRYDVESAVEAIYNFLNEDYEFETDADRIRRELEEKQAKQQKELEDFKKMMADMLASQNSSKEQEDLKKQREELKKIQEDLKKQQEELKAQQEAERKRKEQEAAEAEKKRKEQEAAEAEKKRKEQEAAEAEKKRKEQEELQKNLLDMLAKQNSLKESDDLEKQKAAEAERKKKEQELKTQKEYLEWIKAKEDKEAESKVQKEAERIRKEQELKARQDAERIRKEHLTIRELLNLKKKTNNDVNNSTNAQNDNANNPISTQPQPTATPSTTNHNKDIIKREGNSVIFGSFFNKDSRAKEPLKWDILEEKYGKALIITHDIIDSKAFNTNRTNNYEKSSIRNWLNNDFYNMAFNVEEKKKIQSTLVDNTLSSTGDDENKNVCNDTKDNVFLLSVKEAKTYYEMDAARKAIGTEYAKGHGLFVNSSDKNSAWRLRSPHNTYPTYAYFVNYNGEIGANYAHYSNYGVRPACWVIIDEAKAAEHQKEELRKQQEELKAQQETAEAEKIKKEQEELKPIDANINQNDSTSINQDSTYNTSSENEQIIIRDGNTIIFGSYYNKDDKSKEPLKWDILEEKDGKALIITHDVIDEESFLPGNWYISKKIKTGLFKSTEMCFNISKDVPNDIYANNYEYSNIRRWLNNYFYNTAFNEEEKKKIQLTLVDNSLSSTSVETNDYVCNNTQDNIFLLSQKEAYKYYKTSEKRNAKRTEYAIKKGVDRGVFWWLRSPDYKDSHYACIINDYGDVSSYSVGSAGLGVRPVCWITLK